MTTNIVKYQTDKGEIELSKETIKNYLVSGDASKVTDQELEMALRLCQYQGLNPFLREVYIIKYGNNPANIIVGKDVFTKRAMKNPKCKGFEAGIIIINANGEIEQRKGSFYVKGKEELVGGWANVFIKDWVLPIEHTVAFQEYTTGKSTWNTIPGTMIRKVALVQALREAFPEDFQGLYDSSEMGMDLPDTSGDMQAALRETRMKHGIYGEDETIEDDEIIDEIPIEEVEEAFDELITDAQRKRMFAISKSNGEIVKGVIKVYGYESTKDIKKTDYQAICADIEKLLAIDNNVEVVE